jgi:peptidoglycan/LPS O-acetylase OafA/YrhL
MPTLFVSDTSSSHLKSSSPKAPLIRPYMPELDSLRGIAIVLVLFFHGMAPPINAQLSHLGKFLLVFSRYGWAGVNLFFVLSGFLITGILLDSKAKPVYFRPFYLRRALRILPALYTTLAILLIGGWINWRFLILSALFLSNCAPLIGIPMQYGPLWSLAVEEHFYLLWPFLIRKLAVRRLVAFLIGVCLTSPLLRASTALSRGDLQHFVGLYTWLNLDGLALGALLAIWVRQLSFHRPHLSRFALLSLIAGAVGFALVLHHPLAEAALLISACNVSSAGLLSLALLLGTSRWSFLVDRHLLKFLGFISYSLYLIHVLAFRLSEILLSRLLPPLISSWPTVAMLLRFTLGCGLAITTAYLSRTTLEDRFLRIKSEWDNRGN